MNLKKFEIYKVVIVLICIMLLSFAIGLSIIGVSGGFTKDNLLKNISKNTSKSSNVNETKTENVVGVDNISIEVVSCKVNIINEDRADVKAHLFGSSNIKNLPKLKMNIDGAKLNIIVKKESIKEVNLNDIEDLVLDIHIPNNYKNNLSIGGVSADVQIEKQISLKSLNLNLISGDTNIANAQLSNFIYEITSGDLNCEILHTANSNFKATSGDIKINDYKGDIYAKLTSGDVDISYSAFDKNKIDISLTSGDVDLSLPESAAFYVDANTSGGEIDTNFPIIVNKKSDDNELAGNVNNGDTVVKIEATSGDINIKKK